MNFYGLEFMENRTIEGDSLKFFTELIFQNFSPDSKGISVLDKN